MSIITGWPPGLLQDDSRPLSKWLAGRADAWRLARLAAKSAGELPPADRSPEEKTHPGLCPVDEAAAPGGLACDRLPERVPPSGLERAGFVPASDHQSGHRHIVRGPGVLGGLEAGRSGNGGLAEGVKDGSSS